MQGTVIEGLSCTRIQSYFFVFSLYMKSFITHIKGKAGIFSQNALVASCEVLRLNVNNSFSALRWPGTRIERCLSSLTENDFPVSTMLEKKEM
jgi:hypothetical protein